MLLLGILSAQGEAPAGGAYDLLETQVLTSSASSVTFTGLDTLAAGYQHLQLRMVVHAETASAEADLFLRLNNDSGSSYAMHSIRAIGTQASAVTAANQISQQQISFASAAPGNANSANTYSAAVLDLLDFANTSKTTTVRGFVGHQDGSFKNVALTSGLYNSTQAVTSITMLLQSSLNFSIGSRFSLYGIKGA